MLIQLWKRAYGLSLTGYNHQMPEQPLTTPVGPIPGQTNGEDMPRLVCHSADLVSAEFIASAELKYIKTRDGARIRCAWWPAIDESPRGTVMIMTGFSEFIEKYYEVAQDLQNMGFAVLCFDWRGQGLSTRAHPERKGWVQNYATMVDDALEIAHWLERRGAPSPLLGLGHSMGGNVCIRLLQNHQNLFAAAAVTAPMLGLKGLPNWLLRSLSEAGSRAGLDSRYAPGATDNDPLAPHTPLSSDPRRYEAWRHYLRTDSWLITHGVTWRWVREAVTSIQRAIKPANAERIRTPLLIANPLQDSLVDPVPTRRFAERCGAAQLLEVADSEHELLQETDPLRDQFFHAFDDFVTRHTHVTKPPDTKT